MTTHLGIQLRNKEGGLKLTVDNFIRLSTKDNTLPNFGEFKGMMEKIQVKYDLNMNYFKSLSRDKLNEELNKLVDQNNFTEIADLNSLNGVSGYYIMVLDDYCQTYIGISHNIRQRIMKHWSRQIPLSDLLQGAESGLLPIDCFRALDTTRVYVCHGHEDNYSEDNLINMMHEDRLIYGFPVDYCLNILTFWGSRELFWERRQNLELRDLKIYGKSHLTESIAWHNQRVLRETHRTGEKSDV